MTQNADSWEAKCYELVNSENEWKSQCQLSANKVPESANKTDLQVLFRASPCMKTEQLQRLYLCGFAGFTEERP